VEHRRLPALCIEACPPEAEEEPVPCNEVSPLQDTLAAEELNEMPPLRTAAFPKFAPVIAACQGYACLTGCRFVPEDYRSLQNEEIEMSDALEQLIRAWPVVEDFAERLAVHEEGLVEELKRAASMVAAASALMMVAAAFQAMDMWPPLPTPTDTVDDKDRDYRDLSVPLPLVAQRAFNLKVRQRADDSHRERTAAFLVDYARAVGVSWVEDIFAAESQFLRDFSDTLAAHDEFGQNNQTPRSSTQDIIAKLDTKASELRLGASQWGRGTLRRLRQTRRKISEETNTSSDLSDAYFGEGGWRAARDRARIKLRHLRGACSDECCQGLDHSRVATGRGERWWSSRPSTWVPQIWTASPVPS